MTDATETLSIDAFVEARLREDEETARAAMTWDDTTRWVADHQGVFEVADAIGRDDELIASTGVQHVSDGLEYERATHIARHDPARVLREVAWKRHLLGFALAAFSQESKIGERPGRDPETNAYDKGRADTARFMLRLLAVSWSSHPDFRAEWTA